MIKKHFIFSKLNFFISIFYFSGFNYSLEKLQYLETTKVNIALSLVQLLAVVEATV